MIFPQEKAARGRESAGREGFNARLSRKVGIPRGFFRAARGDNSFSRKEITLTPRGSAVIRVSSLSSPPPAAPLKKNNSKNQDNSEKAACRARASDNPLRRKDLTARAAFIFRADPRGAARGDFSAKKSPWSTSMGRAGHRIIPLDFFREKREN